MRSSDTFRSAITSRCDELPRLADTLRKVVLRHGNRLPGTLVTLQVTFEVPPEDACPTFRGLYHGPAGLELDMHLHVHLENNILFPRAARLPQGRRGLSDQTMPSSRSIDRSSSAW